MTTAQLQRRFKNVVLSLADVSGVMNGRCRIDGLPAGSELLYIGQMPDHCERYAFLFAHESFAKVADFETAPELPVQIIPHVPEQPRESLYKRKSLI